MIWWKKALESLMSAKEGAGLDIFKAFPATRRFLAARHHYAQLRTAGDVLFVVVVISGLFGPQEAQNNFAVFLTWGIIWPVIVLSWFFVGRMWCGICPFPGLGVFLQSKGLTLNLPVPKFLKDYGVYCSVFLLALIIWVESTAGLNYSPAGTSYLIMAIVGGAAIMAILFPGQSWCRHLCPLGRMTGAAATMSITEFRADHRKCKGCKTFACKRGREGRAGCPVYLGAFSVQNNLHCLVCGHCLPFCDRDAPQLLLRNPYNELIKNQGRFITCTYIVPFLMGSQLARFFRENKPLYDSLLSTLHISDALLFSICLVVCSLAVLWVINMGANYFGIKKDPICGRLSPMVPLLIPLAFIGELVYRFTFFAHGVGDFIPTIGRQFSLPLLERLAFAIPSLPVQILSGFFLLNATLASAYILWRFSVVEFSEYITLRSFVMLNILVGSLLVTYLLVIF